MFFALQADNSNMSILTLHLFTIGGIGLITIGMMSRVALGHTGRDIRKPSPWIAVAFASIIASVLFRVFIPMITSQFYTVMGTSRRYFLGAGFYYFCQHLHAYIIKA